MWRKYRRSFLKPFFHIRKDFFQSFPSTFFSSFCLITLASKIFHCLSANHNPELWCVICTDVTLLHHCYSWTVLFSANQNWLIIFFHAYYCGRKEGKHPGQVPQVIASNFLLAKVVIKICLSSNSYTSVTLV